MGFKQLFSTAALAAGAMAQVASFLQSDHSISVHVPSDTASSNSGPIYFQIAAPSGTRWAAFGQGTRMRGAQMFIIYADGNGNVTLSPRMGAGEVEPQYSSSIQATLLSGSTVNSDGSLLANVRCDSCLSWSGGSMSATSTSSNWIFSYLSGNAVDSTSQSADLTQHETHSNFNLDLTTGTGNNNPIVASSGTTTGSGTGSASTPIVSSNANVNSSPSDDESDSNSSNPHLSPFSHGVIMSVLFVGLFPLAALTIYLPVSYKVRFIHAPLQVINIILLITGLVLGVIYGKEIDELDTYHQIIGYIVFALIIGFQPALGIFQHLHYTKTGQRGIAGHAHQWLGRIAIALGIINGGLGWNLAGTTEAYIPYGVIAGVMFLFYLGVILMSTFMKRRSGSVSHEKAAFNTTHSSNANSDVVTPERAI